jgi:hypothetical protein
MALERLGSTADEQYPLRFDDHRADGQQRR